MRCLKRMKRLLKTSKSLLQAPPGMIDIRLLCKEKLQSFAFLVFVVVCTLGSIYLCVVLPETKNKTFMDISHSFAKINKIPELSPGQEMELVLSIKPENETEPDVKKMESFF